MLPFSDEQLEKSISIIGSSNISDDEIEIGILALAQDAMLARRLIDWIPEAFGMVLLPHIGNVTLPSAFSAKNADGGWVEFGFEAEPIFQKALHRASDMFRAGPKDIFANVALKSAMVSAINRALNAGSSIDGAALSGPALIGIPAEVYLSDRKSLLHRLFG